MVVFLTSVLPAVERLRPPAIMATSNRMNSAAPTINTQGSVYQSLLTDELLVVVFLTVTVLPPPSSWAIADKVPKVAKSAPNSLYLSASNESFIFKVLITIEVLKIVPC